ncbi:ABC transporter permease [Chryseosolibacter indicus]|uniref:ABC transporter permease n=1 Tax=Chryseosolibacter indicus TaxID=2782351 RepID=A0ABS5VW20_9BACT|nr:ABC transporter permease [Chryseosolibacter indicus]MBT1705248.1 ABC transporter permease [Chryseosolibacter indicus]
MLKNYLTIAVRNIFRNKLFSFVNILGLAFGMCSALVIFLWVNDEIQVDKFHTNINRLYRVMENQHYSDGRLFTFASTPGPMAPYIKEKYPEIEKASRLTWEVNNLFRFDDKSFYEPGRYADPDFIEMFSIPFNAGNSSTALNGKNSIVISKSMAEKYFGDEDVIGKILLMNTKTPFTVTGVFADMPKNSSLQFQYLLPFQYFFDENKSWLDQWGNNNIRTYLMLRTDATINNFSAKLKNEVKLHNEQSNVELFIQPFGDAYLYGDFENGVQAGGRIEYVRIFFIVAVFVLIIACINFMNLSTAQATKRAKEVGLRKVIGAIPHQLFRQFMGESFLTVIIAACLAVLFLIVLLPFFNEITGKALGLNLLDLRIVMIFVAIVFFTAFLAGSYPAFFISEFKPVQVLKGQLKSGNRASVFRRALVTIQFSLSIILIISTAVVFRQMQFMQNRDIGFDRNNVFYAWLDGDVANNLETVRNRLLSLPGIDGVTAASQLPIDIGNSTSNLSWEGKDPEANILFSVLAVDQDFIQTMKMEMIEGRPFDRNLVTDTANYIVNQKAAEKLGFKDEVAGKDLTLWDRKGKIIGVVKDFNFGSLHNPIEPLILRVPRNDFFCLLIRAKQNETEAAIRSAEGIWKEYAPGYPFKYSFLNQDWEEFYKAEGQRGKVFNTLAILSIFISCLGLFGLSAFSAERRTKELGIRKVLGASVPGLVQLMNKEFITLVILSAIIGCPLGWYLMSMWLENYAYHVEVGLITLIVAASVCLTIAVITVSYHSLRVASTNPAKSLRYE